MIEELIDKKKLICLNDEQVPNLKKIYLNIRIKKIHRREVSRKQQWEEVTIPLLVK